MHDFRQVSGRHGPAVFLSLLLSFLVGIPAATGQVSRDLPTYEQSAGHKAAAIQRLSRATVNDIAPEPGSAPLLPDAPPVFSTLHSYPGHSGASAEQRQSGPATRTPYQPRAPPAA